MTRFVILLSLNVLAIRDNLEPNRLDEPGLLEPQSLDEQKWLQAIQSAVKEIDKKSAEKSEPLGADRHAYVTLWFQAPSTSLNSSSFMQTRNGDGPRSGPQGVIKLAKQLRQHQVKYPLIVLTNSDKVKSEIEMSETRENVIVMDFKPIDVKCTAYIEPHWFHTFQKLEIFNISGYDKLLWLDADVSISQNIDRFFDVDLANGLKVYAQADDPKCNGIFDTPLCSGVLLFQPSQKVAKDLVSKLNSKMYCPPGDQNLLAEYFAEQNVEVGLYSKEQVIFSSCGEDAAIVHHAWDT